MTIASNAPFRGTRTARVLRQFGIVWITILLIIYLAFTTPGFTNGVNLSNILSQQAEILIVAAPFTLTLIAGSFDVSISAIYVTAPLAAVQVEIATGSTWLAVLVGVVVGALCGVLNAVAVTVFHINSFIATLATSFVIFGIGYVVSAQSILTPSDPSFRNLSRTNVLGVTSATVYAIVIVAVFWIVLARTRYGRYVYATGASPDAAHLSGVRTGAILASTFVLVGAATGFAGVVNAAQSLSAQPSDDFTFVFAVIAAVVVGGNSISGGSGAVWRTVVGAIFIALVGNGFDLNQVDPILQRVVLGVVILLAVGVDAYGRRSHTR